MATKTTVSRENINIRPGVSILSVLKHLNYKPWYAIAEFVDNSVQSYIDNRAALENSSEKYRLKVEIVIDPSDKGKIIIRDNAAGIEEKNFPRAFRPAEIPPDQDGLNEFGMGMKSAACWFASSWIVRTTALNEDSERTIKFDVNKIIYDSIEELTVSVIKVPRQMHYTEIVLDGLHRPLHPRTIEKIKDHLASIYREFLRPGEIILKVNEDELKFVDPEILVASPFNNTKAAPVKWQKKINIKLASGIKVKGFAALRDVASTSRAGFALLRRGRLIEGSADDGYRPEQIFKKSNSYIYQRLFGELHLLGFEVSHTKDGIRWGDMESSFLEKLKVELDKDPIPLLKQAEGHRVRIKTPDISTVADEVNLRTVLLFRNFYRQLSLVK